MTIWQMRRAGAALAIGLVGGFAFGASLSGVVYDDANADGIRDAGEAGIAGVAVWVGGDVAVTDSAGRYELTRPDAGKTTAWVSVPAAYRARLAPKTNVPLFYKVIAEGAAANNVDFALVKRENAADKFRVIVSADPQVGDMRQVDYYREDVLSELVGAEADFIATLGDLTGDRVELIRPIADATGVLGIENRAAIGNHDRVVEAENVEQSEAAFREVYGPTYYSFDRGAAHFVFLNTLMFTGKGYGYKFGIDERQLEWLKKDLELAPQGSMVVLMVHAPVFGQKREAGENVPQLLEALAGRNVLVLGGHWHANNRYDLGEADGWNSTTWFVQQAVPAACGSFWGGPTDLRGIPVSDSPDGTPNGYTVWQFDGAKMPVGTFKAASLPTENQMRILTPDLLGGGYWNTGTMVVNYYFGYEKSVVEYSVNGGAWTAMERTEMADPEVAQLMDGVAAHRWIPTLWVQPSKHIWKADTLNNLVSGLNAVRVRATEPDGRIITQGRAFKATVPAAAK